MGPRKKEQGYQTVKKVLTKEEQVLNIAEDFKESKLPQKLDILMVSRKFTSDKTPIDAVLTQEIKRYNMLKYRMKETLEDIIISLKGEIAMNAEIKKTMNAIFKGILPIQGRILAPVTQKHRNPS